MRGPSTAPKARRRRAASPLDSAAAVAAAVAATTRRGAADAVARRAARRGAAQRGGTWCGARTRLARGRAVAARGPDSADADSTRRRARRRQRRRARRRGTIGLGGCESGFTLPDLTDPNIVWASCYGERSHALRPSHEARALGEPVDSHARLAAEQAQVPLPLDAAAGDRSVRSQHGVLRLPGRIQDL